MLVYCEGTGRVYRVPAEETGSKTCALRVESPRNHQAVGVRWTRDYES